MIKLFLADDEPIIVRGLKKIIDWNSFNIEIIGEAHDGKNAQKLIYELRPDLVISDICMPGINGIDMLKAIKKNNVKTKVIFLSGYQEFSYARDAVTYGAIEYILKPVDKNQLEAAVKKAVELINKDKEDIQLRNKLWNYETESNSISMDKMLERLVRGYADSGSYSEDITCYGFSENSEYFTVLNIEIDEFNTKLSAQSEQEVKLVKFAVFNLAEEVINNNKAGVLFHKGYNICSILNSDNYNTAVEQANRTAVEIREAVQANLHKSVTIGIGETVKGIYIIRKSYEDSVEALKAKFFWENSGVISIKDLEQKDKTVEDLYDVQKALAKSIIANDKEAIIDKYEVLLNVVSSISNGNRDSALSYCLSTIAFIGKELALAGILPDRDNEKKNDYLSQMKQYDTYSGLREYMRNWLQEVSTLIADNVKNSGESIEIKKVKEYIENNYNKNITLETAAGIACMNAYYFSSFFKKQTGENFKDFLIKVRMEMALKILLNTNCKVYEIAEQVGFNDSKHFSDTFKKYYGNSPVDYKNSIARRN